ncbi:hypothetical protein [Collinsella aerofaciens]|uniref:hypothetical protein n=1 Tax=Collinsella aerofaciens TaxID=74426 RepID=UPI003981DB64
MLGNDAWIGCCVQIMSGVTVGSHAIVGEVVARNFPERPVVGGVPARVIHKRKDIPGH